MNVLPRVDVSRFTVGACFLRERHEAATALESLGITPLFLNRRTLDPRAFTDLVRVIRTRRIDVLHLCGMGGTFWGRMAARWAGCRSVAQFHEASTMPEWVAFLQRRVAPWTDWSLAVSDTVRDWCGRRFGLPADRFETLPNGIPIEQFAVDRAEARDQINRELHIDDASPVLAIVGRLSWEKGHQCLFEALARIRSDLPNMTLLVIGDGELRETLERSAGKLGLANHIRFLGFRTDVAELLAASDLCVMASLDEGMPLAIIEAQASGVPVVTTDVGGIPEIVENEVTALLVPPNDAVALGDAIRRVMLDETLARQLVERSRSTVQRYGIEPHVHRLEAIYASLATGGRVSS
jgi:glycosyltransferase involved in cell wall biosynthesis